MDCEECRGTYELEDSDPPCEGCKKPEALSSKNYEIIRLWTRCNNFEREYSDMSGMPKRLKTADILPVCESYGCTRDDIENVLMVEATVFPFLQISAKERQERK